MERDYDVINFISKCLYMKKAYSSQFADIKIAKFYAY